MRTLGGLRSARAFAGIAAGTVVAQALAFVALPVLARLYDPVAIAHFAFLTAIGTVTASVAGLRLELAIPLPEQSESSRQLFWMSVLAPLLVLPTLALGTWAAHEAGLDLLPGLDALDYLLVAIFTILVTYYSGGSQLAIRQQTYGVLARIPMIQMVGTLVAQIALGLVGMGRGLFVGSLLGRSLGIFDLLRASRVRLGDIPSRSEAQHLLREYWRFPAFFAPAGLVNALGASIAFMMMPTLFGFGPAGLFAMASRVAGVPTTVISEAAAKVFLGEFARATSQATSFRLFLRWSGWLATLGVAVAGAMWFLAPLVLPPLLGPAWDGTVVLVQYTGVMAGAAIAASPLQHVWTVRQRGVLQFTWNFLRLASTAGAIALGAQRDMSLPDVMETLAIVTVAVYAIGWLGCLWAVAHPAAGQRNLTASIGPEG